jgi:sec-independent protein translocase protein TatB
MFSIDFPEIVIIFGIALVVLGPKKLPGAAAQIGRWVGRARSMARQFREQLEQEVNTVESSLDLKKAMETPAAEPTSRPAAETEAAPAAASRGGATEHASSAEHTGTTAQREGASVATPEVEPLEGAARAGDPAEAAADEPIMDQWPQTAGGWSPDSLIAASMPNSEPEVAESAASAGREPEPSHPSVHICASAGGRRGGSDGAR